MLQTLWPTGELNFNKPNDITGEYKAIKCTELAQRPTLESGENLQLGWSLAILQRRSEGTFVVSPSDLHTNLSLYRRSLNSNDLLPDSIATYTIAIAMADELPDVTDVMANRRKLISTSPAYNRRVQSK